MMEAGAFDLPTRSGTLRATPRGERREPSRAWRAAASLESVRRRFRRAHARLPCPALRAPEGARGIPAGWALDPATATPSKCNRNTIGTAAGKAPTWNSSPLGAQASRLPGCRRQPIRRSRQDAGAPSEEPAGCRRSQREAGRMPALPARSRQDAGAPSEPSTGGGPILEKRSSPGSRFPWIVCGRGGSCWEQLAGRATPHGTKAPCYEGQAP